MGKCGEYAADGLAATAHVDHVIIPNASKGADGAQLAISAFCGGNLGTDGDVNDATICSKLPLNYIHKDYRG